MKWWPFCQDLNVLTRKMRDSSTSGNVDNSTNWSQIPNIVRETIMSFNGLLGWKTLHHPPRRYPAIRPGLPQEGSGKSFNTRQCCQPGSPAEPDFQHCLGTHHRAPNDNYQVEKLPITLPDAIQPSGLACHRRDQGSPWTPDNVANLTH